ncbi:MAG: hypothetical protein E7597_04115 [Ruminococcaceae bacterium]|nr:hypothetical protein [Oscillospiraceae bacterium]
MGRSGRYSYDTSGMYNRNNNYLNVEIERYIEQYWGTSIGTSVRNMYENGTDYEKICDMIGWDYDDFCND